VAESFSFIESAIVFNTKNFLDLQKQSFDDKDFSIHGDAYQFILDYFDECGKFPQNSLLKEKFIDLDVSAIGVDLIYAIKIFYKQVLFRLAVPTIKKYNKPIVDSPEEAIPNLISDLEELVVRFNDDIVLYDDGSDRRLQKFLERKSQRSLDKLGIIGYPTPFASLNNIGVGIQPGELYSLYARPTIGKTWMCVTMAAIAARLHKKVLFITCEMPSNKIEARLDIVLANKMGYEFSHSELVSGGNLDQEAYSDFLKKLDKNSVLICDHIGHKEITVSGVLSLVRKYKPSILIIDNIHLLGVDSVKESAAWERNFNLFRRIKTLCVSQRIAAFVTTQAGRGAYDLFKPPKATEVYLGDALLQNSDIVFSMCMDEHDEYVREVHIQKTRDLIAPVDYMIFDWHVDTGLIKEREGKKYVQ